MLLKTKLGHTIELPTAEEDALIHAGMMADPDTRELDTEWFARAKPANEFFSTEAYTELIALKRPRGRPKADETKVLTSIRLDVDLLETFKSTGKGWQTRINSALRQFITEHPVESK